MELQQQLQTAFDGLIYRFNKGLLHLEAAQRW